jgi:hypothetical protein
MTIGEASAFWDEHSLFEFNGTEEIDVTFKMAENYNAKNFQPQDSKTKHFFYSAASKKSTDTLLD